MEEIKPAEKQNPHPQSHGPNNFFGNKMAIVTIASLGGLILLVGTFAAGLNIGRREARFSESWGRYYPQNFGYVMPPPESGRMMMFNAHGVFGTILSIDKNTLTIKGTDNTEKTVLISSGTTIRQNTQDLKTMDLKVNQQIVVIGTPNEQGQINAELIRILNQ